MLRKICFLAILAIVAATSTASAQQPYWDGYRWVYPQNPQGPPRVPPPSNPFADPNTGNTDPDLNRVSGSSYRDNGFVWNGFQWVRSTSTETTRESFHSPLRDAEIPGTRQYYWTTDAYGNRVQAVRWKSYDGQWHGETVTNTIARDGSQNTDTVRYLQIPSNAGGASGPANVDGPAPTGHGQPQPVHRYPGRRFYQQPGSANPAAPPDHFMPRR